MATAMADVGGGGEPDHEQLDQRREDQYGEQAPVPAQLGEFLSKQACDAS